MKNHSAKIRAAAIIFFTFSALIGKAEVPSASCFYYFSLAYSSLTIGNSSEISIFGKEEVQQSSNNVILFRNVKLRYRNPEIKVIQPSEKQSALYTIEKNNVEFPKLTDIEICSRARSDAENFHGKKTAYFIGGIIFGPLAILNAAAIKHRPSQGNLTPVMSESKEFFEDPTYKACYNRRAKWILVKEASIGTILWSILGSALIVAFK